ncbi:MAG: hypothetical protein ACTSVI_16360 [Promethearchaeota archaeon]
MQFTFKFPDIIQGKDPITLDADNDTQFITIILKFLDVLNSILPDESKVDLSQISILNSVFTPLKLVDVRKTSREILEEHGSEFSVTYRMKTGSEDLSVAFFSIEENNLDNLLASPGGPVASTVSLPSPPPHPSVEKSSRTPDSKKGLPAPGGAEVQSPSFKPSVLAPEGNDTSAKKQVTKDVVINDENLLEVNKSEVAGSVTDKVAKKKGSPENVLKHDEYPATTVAADSFKEPSTGGLDTMDEFNDEREELRLGDQAFLKEDKKIKRKSLQSRGKNKPGELISPDDDSLISVEKGTIAADLSPARFNSYDKHVSLEYFDVMNPESYYPLFVDIADKEQERIKNEENIITGERKIQAKDEIHVELAVPVVTVKPIFPGCAVTPLELKTNFKDKHDRLTFYVTPLVKDEIEGHVEFIDSSGTTFQVIKTPAKCKDPRHARVIALYGLLISIFPKVTEFFGFNVDDTISSVAGFFNNISFTAFFAILGSIGAISIAIIYFLRQKPTIAKVSYHLADFKMKVLKHEAAISGHA